MSYFCSTNYTIFGNPNLRKPQVYGYYQLLNHFENGNEKEHAIIILPTGVGKTVLMAMTPFGIAKKKVLIIAPQLTIRNTIVEALDQLNPNNVYRKYGILKDGIPLPRLYSYDSSLNFRAQQDLLSNADIVVLNVHKLQARLETSPLNYLSEDYFDMIIIDEAHHSAACTWTETCKHFSMAKVVKVTATNFRTDGVAVEGKVVYTYDLASAMTDNYVKSLEQQKYIPDKLLLTIDNDNSKTYTVEEIYALNLKDEDWVNRSVAYSYECNKIVAQNSLNALNELKKHSTVPHKIIAVACNISHAKSIVEVYEELGVRAAVLHSELTDVIKEAIFNDIENHRLDVIVNVNMLGEGYDHKYLTIGAIFRPFKHMLPYLQFVGRLLRRIPDDEATSPNDNIAKLVTHHHLGLDELWEYFKEVAKDAEIIKSLAKEINNNPDYEGTERDVSPIDIGIVTDDAHGVIEKEYFLNNRLIEDKLAEDAERQKKIDEIVKLLSVDQSVAERIVDNNKPENNEARLDQLYAEGRSRLDNRIRYEIVPSIITELGINPKGIDLRDSGIFIGKYRFIAMSNYSNDAMLAIFFNTYLKKEIGFIRADWTFRDYEIASQRLEQQYLNILQELKNELGIILRID